MKIFSDFTLHWWQFSILKLTVLVFGIMLGSNWPEWFAQYNTLWLILFVAGALYLGVFWIQKRI